VAVIVAMQIASITSQSGLLIWLVGLIAACLIVNAFAAIRSVRNVRLRAPARILVEQGSTPREPWELLNEGKRRARLITIESGQRVWARAVEVPGRGSINLLPLDVFHQRGVYSLEKASVVSLFPFGLVKAMQAANCKSDVLVYPKLYETSAPEVRGLDPMLGGRQSGPRRVAVGETFAGVRPLQAGDSFKQIHWKSSAKGGGLMVKTFEEQLAGRAVLLVHCAKGSPHAEACLRAAGSMALAGIEAGHQIEFYNLNEGRRHRFPPFGDTTRLLEELARFDFNEPSASEIKPFIEAIRSRVAIHFVLSDLSGVFESEIDRLIADGKRVFVHLPADQSGRLGWELRHFPTE